MIKVAMIGAGSVVFCKTLTGDLLSFPEFRNATFTYMDVNQERLDVGAALCRKIAKSMDAHPTIQTTRDRKEAIRDADFIIVMVQVGGFDNTLVDFEIPRKYGLNFTIADTTGPGGMMRALRSYPFYRDLVRDALEVAPNAYILNYTNPMSMNMQSIARNGHTRAVGLCHSVQGTFDELMGYIGEKPDDVSFICSGINHMAFYTKIAKDNVDLYPRLFEAMNEQGTFNRNKVRFEMMRRLGYFVTESSEHNAEYNPWFIPHGRETIAKFDVPIDEYLRRCDGIVDEFQRMQKLAQSDEALPIKVSHEYGSQIVHSISTGTPRVVYGNMPNSGGQLASLPKTAIVELPTLVDRAGLQHTAVGEMPPQLIAYMNPHVTQHELFIRGAMEGRRDHLYQAAMFDPLTAATVSPDKIVEMVDELIAGHGFEGQGGFLPKLDAKKSLVPGSGKEFHPPSPASLRASWDNAQKNADDAAIKDWQVIGPFRNGVADAAKLLDTSFSVESSLASDGAIDLKASHNVGGQSFAWKPAKTKKRAFLDAIAAFGQQENCVAYGYAELDAGTHARDAVLKLGSDDGVKLWLNGTLVHTNNVTRGFALTDEVNVRLKPGINRILIKVSQGDGGWGWGVVVPKALF
jgi:alpha-galactosidase